ncbi:2-keto-3-deoxy-L-rhamnonate aldolase [Morella rubra]|uniref:2-keto-3-deoxy-L-rhamnonate aldolase n=1 Tax=Morella rubra TaxID=262757 RepID=A0A6A1VTX1_9ROSI|nr:2-keto-3-deoxy-L-rhamnonate aldolase [Morella rubra]
MATLKYTPTTAAASSLSTLRSKPFAFNTSKLLSFSFKTQNPTSTTFKTLTPLKSSSNTTSTTTNPSDLSPVVSTVPPETLKSRLRNGETLYGLFLLSFSPTVAEIAGLAGYDFVVVDMEHGPGGICDALSCLRALAVTGTPAILRLPESCPTWAKKALDLGPQGIMFPMIEGPKAAKKAVSYCRFPPNGVRGSAHTVVRASAYGIDEGYLGNYEEELLIMCQVESEEAVKRVEEIAAVDGVDCIQMGPLDLSASMGYLWDPANKKVKEMMRVAEKAVLGVQAKADVKGGAFLAGFAMPHDGPDDLRRRGYHMVSGAVDVGLFRSAAVEDVKRFKMGLMDGPDEQEDGKDADDKYWSE